MPDEGAATLALAEKIRHAISCLTFTRVGGLTVSAGVATASLDDDSKDVVFKAADIALYEAKGQGRNRVCSA